MNEAMRIKDSICGFGFFAGDEVKVKLSTGYKFKGIIQFVNPKSKTISIKRVRTNSYLLEPINTFIDKNSVINKTGNRLESSLFPKKIIKEIYDLLPYTRKVYFLFHFYGCNKKSVKKISNKLDVSYKEVVKILKKYYNKGLLK